MSFPKNERRDTNRFSRAWSRRIRTTRCSEAAPIKCAGRESAGRPTDSSVESAGLPTESPIQSAGRLADSLPAHFIGAASGRRDNDDVEYRGRSVIALAAVKHEVRAPFAMKESEEQRGKSAFSLRRKTPISGWREGS